MPVAADPHVEEVRVAMALNGGVSLAVWMGGCAVELDCARRAHAATEELKPEQGEPIERRVYHDLLKAFGREFVVDLLAGASAGGINGALLAAAARKQRRVHPDFLRGKWLQLGDFRELLHRTSEPNPRSVMQGDQFYKLAKLTFEELLAPSEWSDLPDRQAGVDAFPALLDVTVTNVAGEPRGVLDAWGNELFARHHHGRFEFREDGQFEPTNLASAARATASFPAAFEPFLVEGEAAVLAGFAGKRYAIDGGLLDNAPMRAVIDLIPQRPAHRLVKRFVCYLNADPPRREQVKEETLQEPSLPDVLGYVINLPRNAPFYDQLLAVENAIRRRELARDAYDHLLLVTMPSLVETAEALLGAYARRRALDSLDDLALDAGTARRLLDELGDPRELPWVPDDLDVPTSADEWDWGILGAERVLHLQLDVVRGALATGDEEARRRLLEARAGIYAQLSELAAARAAFLQAVDVPALSERLRQGGQVAEELPRLVELSNEARPQVYDAVVAATEVLLEVRDLLDPELGSRLFESNLVDDPVQTFILRALAIEVVRRSFGGDEEVEPASPPAFVQLTPVVRIRILNSRPCRPLEPSHGEMRADSPHTKLTGIRVGHFAAFYRHSWRANDFMWGRLDGATRIVDMLVDPARAGDLGVDKVAKELSSKLVRDDAGAGDDNWLVHEALRDAARGSTELRPEVTAALAGYPDEDAVPAAGDLRGRLEAALRADLADERGGFLTRVVASRAAQLEVLRHELPVLFKQAREDVKRGCFTKALSFEAEADTIQTIKNLRTCPTLPEQLGRDRGDEGVSNLALRTVTHAAFVALSVLRTAKIPLAKVLAAVRAVVLPISGVASREWLYRLATLTGFAAATAFVTARLVRSDSSKVLLEAALSPETLLQVLALAAIAAVGAVPALRAWRAEPEPKPPTAVPAPPSRSHLWRRAEQGTYAAALLGLAVLVPYVLMTWPGPLDKGDIVFAPTMEDAPDGWIVGIALVAILGDVGLRFLRVVKPLRPVIQPLFSHIPQWLVVVVAAAPALYWSVPVLVDKHGDTWWQTATVWSAAAATFTAAFYLVARRS